jgi:hypothetical protein
MVKSFSFFLTASMLVAFAICCATKSTRTLAVLAEALLPLALATVVAHTCQWAVE